MGDNDWPTSTVGLKGAGIAVKKWLVDTVEIDYREKESCGDPAD